MRVYIPYHWNMGSGVEYGVYGNHVLAWAGIPYGGTWEYVEYYDENELKNGQTVSVSTDQYEEWFVVAYEVQ